ncbi:small membrane protein [Desulfocucumis palustris]|uniref:Small membrane protein n=1 Tax=Desulfocucumis palustris TaxID=1898651 RepID=A0A2L2X719_9FIRM|nr:hypothetical protein [Desulfocucumis palustris]GBF31848.1 small membrane protein [Desulfocucumis palustris]
MAEVLKALAGIINFIHDFLLSVSGALNLNLSDKDLHFWLIGIMGIVIFWAVDSVFKRLARWNISVISFVYTFTVLMVLVFGLEIEQGITGRGNMEFKDIVAGLWGFLVVFFAYLIIKTIFILPGKFWGRR